MSLYDGLYDDPVKGKETELKKDVAGWAPGIKLLKSQLQLKKAASATPNKRESFKRSSLAPVVNLKTKKDDAEFMTLPPLGFMPRDVHPDSQILGDRDMNIQDEYDPLWPNDYEKICKDMEEKKEREREEEKNREYEEREKLRRRERYERSNRDRDDNRTSMSMSMRRRQDDEEEERPTPRRSSNIGAAIAPPPSLMEESKPMEVDKQGPSFSSGLGGSVAAKIMAKYGFKEGQGLGKKEQGMKMPPPPTPALLSGIGGPQTSLMEAMKNPSKVVLLRNMVGPGEVDQDLEPETCEECSKYGEVVRCVVFEIPGSQVPDEESVRIFVEFKRMESAIKAVVDLNGRYFGGRVVKGGFYDPDKLARLELNG
ncbi:Splicing factor 45 [Nymphon striatum]|nr:Splicing factor 45 [Nymphon striatum]